MRVNSWYDLVADSMGAIRGERDADKAKLFELRESVRDHRSEREGERVTLEDEWLILSLKGFEVFRVRVEDGKYFVFPSALIPGMKPKEPENLDGSLLAENRDAALQLMARCDAMAYLNHENRAWPEEEEDDEYEDL